MKSQLLENSLYKLENFVRNSFIYVTGNATLQCMPKYRRPLKFKIIPLNIHATNLGSSYFDSFIYDLRTLTEAWVPFTASQHTMLLNTYTTNFKNFIRDSWKHVIIEAQTCNSG